VDEIKKEDFVTVLEAQEIFESWQEYVEFADKLHCIFLGGVPQSFQPYPTEVLEEALLMIANDCLYSGNKKMSEDIKHTMCLWCSTKSDEEVLSSMKRSLDLIESHPDFKKAVLEKLKNAQNNWIEVRKERNRNK